MLVTNRYSIRLFPAGTEPRAVAVILAGEDSTEKTAALLPSDVAAAFVGGLDWNGDLSPWAAPKVFKGENDFLGKGAAFLSVLTERILPVVKEELHSDAPVILAGYSLAGLFAAWAATKTEAFAAIASVSGSLWYDGFACYLEENKFRCRDAYFSVGEREKFTHNQRMAAVEECAEKAARKAARDGCAAAFILNPGNHFQHIPQRVADGITWCADEFRKK